MRGHPQGPARKPQENRKSRTRERPAQESGPPRGRAQLPGQLRLGPLVGADDDHPRPAQRQRLRQLRRPSPPPTPPSPAPPPPRPGPGRAASRTPGGSPRAWRSSPGSSWAKIPPPSLSGTTTVRSGAASPSPSSSPVRSCRKVRSPISANAGPAVRQRRRPTAVEIVPSMPATPRLASTVRSRPRHGQPVDVAHRRGRAEHQQRAGRAARRRRRGPAGRRSAPARRRAPRRPRRPTAAGAPPARPSTQPAVGRSAPVGPARTPRRRRRCVRPGVGPARGRAPTVSTRTAGSASSAATGRDSVGRPTTTHPVGPVRGQPVRRRRAAARRRAARRPPHAPLLGSATTGQPTLGELRRRRRARSVARDDQRAAAGTGAAAPRRGAPASPAVHGAPSGRPAHGPSERPASSSGSSGSRSARFRCTGPGSAGQRAAARRAAPWRPRDRQ